MQEAIRVSADENAPNDDSHVVLGRHSFFFHSNR